MSGITKAPVTSSAGEGHIEIVPWSYSAINAGTWAIAFDATEIPVWNNSSATNADACSYKAYLSAGTYTIAVVGRKFSVAGITDFLIDAVSQGTLDWYDAGSVQNFRQTIANIVVATSGLKTIQMLVNGKNAGSGGYQLRIGQIVAYRTA